ncbi:MAG: hypothetical protein GF309_08605, partial [Candidatus Lokiarchaeota archaeon]|nr:hypothetical protein [Candidatus Lokiarchaeota archaeon]
MNSLASSQLQSLNHDSERLELGAILKILSIVLALHGAILPPCPTIAASTGHLAAQTISWQIHEVVPESSDIHYNNCSVAVDSNGIAHVFFTGGKNAEDRDTIYYYVPTSPSPPLDVLVAPTLTWAGAQLMEAEYSPGTDSLILLWTEGWGGELFLSNVPVDLALDVRAWSTHFISHDVITASLVVGKGGELHVAFFTFAGVTANYTSSSDDGETWSHPRILHSLPSAEEAAFIHARMTEDETGLLHLTW